MIKQKINPRNELNNFFKNVLSSELVNIKSSKYLQIKTPMSDISNFKILSKSACPVKSRSLKQMYKTMVAQLHPYLTLARISVKNP